MDLDKSFKELKFDGQGLAGPGVAEDTGVSKKQENKTTAKRRSTCANDHQVADVA